MKRSIKKKSLEVMIGTLHKSGKNVCKNYEEMLKQYHANI